MNERIRKLAAQLGYGKERWNSTQEFEKFLEKFTEVIVQECANELLKWESEPFPLDAKSAAGIIKDHFEVK